MSLESSCKHLRVAVITETYPPEINGVANTMGHLVVGLEVRDHQVDLVRPRQPREAPMPGHRVMLVPGLPIPGYPELRFGLPVYWRLRRIWRERRPEICYIATQGPLGHAALRAARSLDVPAITGFHTQFHHYSRHYGLGALRHQIMRALRRFHNRSDATLVPTAELRDELTARGFHGVHVFSRGVDTHLFSPQRRNAGLRRAWGCTETDLAVLYVGRLASEKNIGLAVEAFEGICSEAPSARFVLVGDGPELPRLRKTHPQFRFTGTKTGVELAEHYASCDLFVFPSLTETFGNVVPEAMASGLPVIAFDYAAAGSHIRNRENGITVRSADRASFVRRAVEAARDRPKLRSLGEQARLTTRELSWERVLEVFEQLLLEVVRQRTAAEGHHAATATPPK
ncbi:MAG: glycosyltransferase family 1 protein [Chromatiaceae bacterium]